MIPFLKDIEIQEVLKGVADDAQPFKNDSDCYYNDLCQYFVDICHTKPLFLSIFVFSNH